MPLSLPALTAGLEGVASEPPATASGCAGEWADAIRDYATAVVPASPAVAAAATTLQAALQAAFESGAAAAPMELAMTAFATTVGGGMAGFVAVPPPGPVGFAALFAVWPETHAAAAASVGAAIDTWMRTGTATPTGGGSAVAWS